MYSSGYSQVSKSSPQAQKRMQYRSKGKSCGYYMRIVFFFSSLIQSLIIVSLVLFLVYGKSQDSASTSRIHDLEESFSRLSIENVALRHQRKNLTNLLNVTLTEKARNDWDLVKLRYFSNISAVIIQDIDKKLQQCNSKLFFCENSATFSSRCPINLQPTQGCNCGLLSERLKARLELVESNFTQTTQRMRMEMDQTAKERDNINLEVIRLRRDKSTHEKEVEFFRQKCKDDFSQSLSGIVNVSKAFLDKIDSLFPSCITFQLTCPKQREYLEQIHTNCTSLSMEVEDKLQRYLNSVGGQVSSIQAENSRVKAENWRLSEDYRWCSTNRTGLILQNRQNLDKLQRKHDEEKERLLMDKMRLNGEVEVLNNNIKYKSRAIDHLTELNRQLNMSCMAKPGFGGFPGGATQSQPGWGLGSSGVGQLGRTGTGTGGLGSSFGSFGSAFNKPASAGTGSSSTSLFNSGSSSSLGSAFNKPASGSSSTSLFNSGSSSSLGSAFNKPASSGTGSSSTSLFNSGSSSSLGSAFNKPASSGTGSSSTSLFNSGSSSSLGSAFNKPASGSSSTSYSAFNKPASGSSSSSSLGSAFNKPASTGTGSSSTSLFNSGSSSSAGSGYNKPGSTGTGSSSSSGSSTGSGVNKPASTGGFFSNFGSTGSNPSSSGTGSKPALGGKTSSTYGSSSASSGTSLNKPTTSVKSTSGVGSSSGSTGSTGSTTNKSGSSSSGLSWFGFGGSNTGQSKPGTGTGKGPSTGTSYGGTGSSIGAGRSSGLGGGSYNVAQHLRDLYRINNPSSQEENQDLSLSRILG